MAYTFKNLYDAVLRIGYGATTAADQVAEAKELVNEGYQQFLNDHAWAFLGTTATVYLWPSLTTSSGITVTVAGVGNLTCTATAAAFYPSMVGKTITITDVGDRVIAAYTSSTVVTLATAGACSGKTFSITADGTYALPSDYVSSLDDPVIADDWGRPALIWNTPLELRRKLEISGSGTGPPTEYAVEPPAFVSTTGDQQQLLVCPLPDLVYPAVYRYRRSVAAFTSDSAIPPGSVLHGPAILGCILALWEQQTGGVQGVHYRLYHGTSEREGLLPAAIRRDRESQAGILGRTPVRSRPIVTRTLSTDLSG